MPADKRKQRWLLLPDNLQTSIVEPDPSARNNGWLKQDASMRSQCFFQFIRARNMRWLRKQILRLDRIMSIWIKLKSSLLHRRKLSFRNLSSATLQEKCPCYKVSLYSQALTLAIISFFSLPSSMEASVCCNIRRCLNSWFILFWWSNVPNKPPVPAPSPKMWWEQSSEISNRASKGTRTRFVGSIYSPSLNRKLKRYEKSKLLDYPSHGRSYPTGPVHHWLNITNTKPLSHSSLLAILRGGDYTLN